MTSNPSSPRPTFADKLINFIWARPTSDLGERTRRRVVVHLIPFLFCLYILAYLDRVNVSVAKLRMQAPPANGGLGFNEKVVGFGAGIFFWGYWMLEIPSTLSVLRWGARWVFVRILVLWGVACVMIGTVGTPLGTQLFGWLGSSFGDGLFKGVGWVAQHIFRVKDVDGLKMDDLVVRQFYFLRFLLGFFEGGFFPSVILYLTLWFRPQDRAKAIATFMAAIPISSMLGSPLSGAMLHLDWFGLPGWRWIFILQGVAPIIAGFITLFFLPDRPEKARWLAPDERTWLLSELHHEHLSRPSHGHWAWLSQAGTVLLLTGYYFCINVTSYGLSIFMPSIIKKQSGLSDTLASLVAGLPYAMGLVGMLANGWHSDRTRERIGHVVVPLTCLSLSIFLAALLTGAWIFPVFVMIFLVGTFMYAHLPAFWPLPSVFLGATAAASAIGFINMIGNVGGFVGPTIVGEAAEGQATFAPALFRLAPFPLIAVALALIVGFTRRKALAAGRSVARP
jgi:MFS transporter, ACS family, tartrate transporter